MVIFKAGEQSRGPSFLETPSHQSPTGGITSSCRARCPWRQSQARWRHQPQDAVLHEECSFFLIVRRSTLTLLTPNSSTRAHKSNVLQEPSR